MPIRDREGAPDYGLDAVTPGYKTINQATQGAIRALVEEVAREQQLLNGKTALYWHLRAVVNAHIGEKS